MMGCDGEEMLAGRGDNDASKRVWGEVDKDDGR